MAATQLISLTDADGSLAVVAPALGGWLLRYARNLPPHGLVEALHFDPAVLERHPQGMYAGNPVLFPLVSNNRVGDKDHHYEWNGKVFELPQHGFARRCPWTVVAQSVNAVTMELTDSPATRAQFPFAFRHRLTYRLDQGRLHWEQVVENLSAEPMPFSTGFHPYFQVPFTPKSRRELCFVEIPDARRMTPVGKYDRFTATPFPGQNWSVQEDIADTLLLGNLKKAEMILVDPGSDLELALNWEDAPQHRFAALWARSTDAPFFCIEPWTALPNSFSRAAKDHELIVLEPQRTFRAAMGMELRTMG